MTWGLITTKNLELRKRRGLMAAIAVLVLALPVLLLGFRLLFHLIDPAKYGPAGSPGIFGSVTNALAEFGFIAAATLGAAAATTDLSEGMFRHLVITGRSRLSLYLARIPAGLAIILSVMAVAFTMLCLVTSYEGVPQPATVSVNGTAIPANESQAGLESWLRQHPQAATQAFSQAPLLIGPQGPAPASVRAFEATVGRDIGTIDAEYTSAQNAGSNPAINEMFKIGLWLELVAGIGFLAELGLGSLTGQRTLTTVLLIALEIIVTPILAAHVIPYFLDGQRLFAGIALDQLRPAALGAGSLAGGAGPGGPGHVLFGGRAALAIPPMPTWAMICVIVGWAVGWSAIGAWRMVTRDA
jgi:hypothetical protein